MKNYTLEACVDSVESALAAQNGGATRLELCGNLVIGGTTPSIALFESIKRRVSIPVNVLVRPRFGDFCYTPYELEVLQAEVAAFVRGGADGIVCGVLRPDGSLDKEVLHELISLCKGVPFTLHRAFDMCKSLDAALETAKSLGVSTILTSGGVNLCIDATDTLKRLVQASGAVNILVGSGVNAKVMPALLERTGAHCYHLSGKKERASAMVWRNGSVSMGLPLMSEYVIYQTDSAEINSIREILEARFEI